MRNGRLVIVLLAAVSMAGCQMVEMVITVKPARTFGDDLEFLKQHTNVLVLTDDEGKAQVAVVPAYQGRVMTSTAAGAAGASFGWINRELIASGRIDAHMNAYGGEERFWMGPEGGQFSIFFAEGAEFNLDNWQTPPVIDTEPFDVVSQTNTTATFRRLTRLTNYSGTIFDIQINRCVKLLPAESHASALGVDIGKTTRAVV